MRVPRIYQPNLDTTKAAVPLSAEASHHIARVLRMSPNQIVHLFGGSGLVYPATIVDVDKKHVTVTIAAGSIVNLESPLHIHLGQVISRGDRMEYTIQKSVELGVDEITPLFSTRCGVKLTGERLEKKQQQWQKVAIAACEQCGRNRIPVIHPASTLLQWCQQQHNGINLTLHLAATRSIASLPDGIRYIRLLIGSEGGLCPAEIELTRQQHFLEMALGPRVLCTETAALAIISALQTRFGDFR